MSSFSNLSPMVDVLAPGTGEIVGGSQREERLDVLRSNLAHHDLPEEEYWWYMDLRKFGTVPHAGSQGKDGVFQERCTVRFLDVVHAFLAGR